MAESTNKIIPETPLTPQRYLQKNIWVEFPTIKIRVATKHVNSFNTLNSFKYSLILYYYTVFTIIHAQFDCKLIDGYVERGEERMTAVKKHV